MFVRSEVKSKIDSIWNKFWSGGIANPLNAIEQITALIFLKPNLLPYIFYSGFKKYDNSSSHHFTRILNDYGVLSYNPGV